MLQWFAGDQIRNVAVRKPGLCLRTLTRQACCLPHLEQVLDWAERSTASVEWGGVEARSIAGVQGDRSCL